jgi:outer membrane protein TolC
MLLPGDADVIKAEILKLEQKMLELKTGKASGIEMLSELMDTTLDKQINLVPPTLLLSENESELHRPEYKLLELQDERIKKSDQLNKAYRYPYLALFGQFGYGYPGMNMLQDKADIIYSFGINLSWNIWDWGKVRRESTISRINSEKLNTQREVFDKNLRMAMVQEKDKIKQLQESLESDDEIIALRQRITSAKSSQLKNGIITSSEYIVELNAEMQARINKQIREILLLKSLVRLNTLSGNLLISK